MKDVKLFFFSLIAFIFAGAIIVTQRRTLTTIDLVAAGGMVIVGFFLSAPADSKSALDAITGKVLLLKGGSGTSVNKPDAPS